MIKFAKHQYGLSSISWLAIIFISVTVVYLAFKLVPVYAQNRYIVSGLKSLKDLENKEGDFSGVSNAEINRHLVNFFTINNVRGGVTNKVEIERKKDRFLVNVNYESKVSILKDSLLMRTVDVVVTFENQFDSSRPDECCKPESE